MELPEYVEKLFVDWGYARPSVENHSRVIIEKILKFGDWEAIKWMYQTFDLGRIRTAALSSRELTSREVGFWSLLLGIPKEKFRWISRY